MTTDAGSNLCGAVELVGAARASRARALKVSTTMPKDKDKPLDPRGLDVHGAEPVSHRFTIADADGNADVELNFSLPLTRRRHALLEHLLEEGYSQHEAYVLLVGGEIMAHVEAIKNRRRND